MVIEITNVCYNCGKLTKHKLPPRAKRLKAKCAWCGKVEEIVIERVNGNK